MIGSTFPKEYVRSRFRTPYVCCASRKPKAASPLPRPARCFFSGPSMEASAPSPQFPESKTQSPPPTPSLVLTIENEEPEDFSLSVRLEGSVTALGRNWARKLNQLRKSPSAVCTNNVRRYDARKKEHKDWLQGQYDKRNVFSLRWPPSSSSTEDTIKKKQTFCQRIRVG